MSYTPPQCDRIPFVFGPSGYTPPACDKVNFDFIGYAESGVLNAAIQVMQPIDYINSTYTYTKSCPAYVIGYGDQTLQVLNGKCSYGGIRGIMASLTGEGIPLPDMSLSDINAFIRGVVYRGIGAVIDSHQYTYVKGSIRAWHSEYRNVSSFIEGFTFEDISASIESHSPSDLKAFVFVNQRLDKNIQSSIMVWDTKSLSASTNILSASSISSTIGSVLPVGINAYLNIIQRSSMPATVHGFMSSAIYSTIKAIYSSNITALVHGRDDMHKTLHANVKGLVHDQKSLNAFSGAMHKSDLSVLLRAKYLKSIRAFLFPVLPINIRASIHSWDVSIVSASILGSLFPWKLTASITPSGGISNLPSSIHPLASIGNYEALYARIVAWKVETMGAIITSSPANILRAEIASIGCGISIHASINPKVIRLTTVIDIATMASRVITGVINSGCFKSDSKNISASIASKYKYDLSAYIKPISTYTHLPLTASIGNSDSYMVTDKLPISVTIFPDSYFTMDKYSLMVNILNKASILRSYINGTLMYNSLKSSINGQEIPSYTFDRALKNREIVAHRSYDGVLNEYEVVEISFDDVVADYFYSDSSMKLWKKDKFDTWRLDVKSIGVEDASANLKRRLNRALLLKDIRRFKTVDEAIRYAIDYVSMRPVATIGCAITAAGGFSKLTTTINSVTKLSNTSSISSSITPINSYVIINTGNGIIRL